ncbi:MAG: glycosyltransferase [Lachnospiraceae bacterium]|nr:glycosyltransferase [Lachnospiraceae bacterium]
MPNKKLVSIVLPSYNGAKYLSKSIESVIDQTYKNWELIIVDDCSTDDTLKIANEYAQNDKRIRILHNEVNLQLPKSLNNGFRASRGELLTWTSDDNKFLPDAIEIMADKLKNENTYFVCADMQTIDSEGKVTGWGFTYDESTMLIHDTVGACFMYKREVFDKVGEYDEKLFCAEDYDYWLRVLKEFKHIIHIPECLYQYRYQEASLTSTKADRVIKIRTFIYDKYIDEILEQFKDKEKWLISVYYDYIVSGRMNEELQKKFFAKAKILKKEQTAFSRKDRYLVFGAGKYGYKTYEKLGEQIDCFIDNNAEKQGTYLEGIPIYSLDKAINTYPDGKIIIAIGGEHMYDAIQQIFNAGKENYWTYQSLKFFNI